MAMRIKLRKVRLQTHQVIQERGVQLKECMEQLEAEHMRLAALFIIQGVIIDVVGGCRDCAFGQVSRQLAKFQEKVYWRLKQVKGGHASTSTRSMSKVSHQPQGKNKG